MPKEELEQLEDINLIPTMLCQLKSDYKKGIIDLVLKQIERDFESQDLTAIEELLSNLSVDTLENFLPE